MWCAPIWMGWRSQHEGFSMRSETALSAANSHADIDPRSVPKTRVNWPVAFRLKPAKFPGTAPLSLLVSDGASQLAALKDTTSPAVRHKLRQVPLPLKVPAGTPTTILSAFASSVPEWRFAARGTPHMVLASSVTAAVSVASEIYSQFMRDTAQKASTLSFVVERFCLAGQFSDICDSETFPACYAGPSITVPQQLVTAINENGEDGLVFDVIGGQAAVALNPATIKNAGLERALALEWNGETFHRLYDYRDMYWRDL